MKLNALSRTCPHLSLRLPEYLCGISNKLLSFRLWLKVPVKPNSTADTHSMTHKQMGELAFLCRRNIKGFWSLVKKLKIYIMAKFECIAKRWDVFTFLPTGWYCPQYVIPFAFSVMNLSDYIFVIHIKIVINKIDVYNIRSLFPWGTLRLRNEMWPCKVDFLVLYSRDRQVTYE